MRDPFKISVLHVEQPEYNLKSKKILEEIKCAQENLGALPILEMFRGFEGEGALIGEPRVLIRVGGCAVACHGCDTPHSWGTSTSTVMSIAEIITELYKIGADKINTIAITGGEPSHYPSQTAALAQALRERGWNTWLETSGLLIDTNYFNWFNYISLDIKMPYSKAEPNAQQIRKIIEYSLLTPQPHQVKAIVSCKEDLDWLEENFRPLLIQKQRPLIITPGTGNKETHPAHNNAAFDLVHDWIRPEYNVRVIAQQHVLLKQR